tara:strand:- start:202200 stop:202631 length:432 start_codon:yes stop_codon:yes gene_type:complete
MILYLLGNKFHKWRLPLLPKICDVLIRLIHNCAIYSETQIGEGTIFGYGGIAVVIHKRAVIGKNCIIGSNVTIGGRSRSIDVPVIGDDVYIATGAKILGAITIGDNCIIGANAVVLIDMPANSMAVGVPAKIIKTDIDISDFR